MMHFEIEDEFSDKPTICMEWKNTLIIPVFCEAAKIEVSSCGVITKDEDVDANRIG